MDSIKEVHTLGIDLDLPANSPTNCPSHPLSPAFTGLSLVLCKFPSCQSRGNELLLAQLSYFFDFPHYGLDPFAHIIALLSLPLDSRSSAQCLTIDLCACLSQLLDEGSMLTIMVVLNLIILVYSW